MGKNMVSLMAEVPVNVTENEQGWIHIFPLGEFPARDGRPGTLYVPAKTWILTEESAQEVIHCWEERQTPLVVDYEHQTYETHENGQPAPAAGWVKELIFHENGLFAVVEWTSRAKEYIRSGEYRYISPTFLFDVNTGVILELCSIALTNNPALDGLEPVQAKTKSKDIYQQSVSIERNPSKKWQQQQHTHSVTNKKKQDSFVAVTKHKNQTKVQPEFIQLLHEAQETIVSLTKQVQEFEKKEEALKLEKSIQQALQDGRLHQSCETWARACAISYPEVLQGFLDASSPIVALVSMQTQNRIANTHIENRTVLSKEENHVRSQLGMSVETFIKHKKECQ